MELKFIDLILEKFYLSLPPKLQNPVFLWQISYIIYISAIYHPTKNVSVIEFL